MKKQPKPQASRTPVRRAKNTPELDTQSAIWPPPDIDPTDTRALTAALPWNQPSEMVPVPFQTLESDDEDDDGLTPEQRREQWMRTASPEEIEWLSCRDLQSKCTEYSRNKHLGSYQHTMSRTHPRDTTAGIYVGAGEAFHNAVAKACDKGQTPDNNAIEILLKAQPYRKAIAIAPNRQQPVPTFGPMQLPQSRDPVAGMDTKISTETEIEPRPTHWTPETPASHIISGAIHDFGNYLSTLIARQVVAIGFMADTEAIANARSLARTLKDFQHITHTQEERSAQKARKTSPGRPSKSTLIDPEKAISLRLEIVERNKKYQNKKYKAITLTESTPEAEINTESPTPEDSRPNALKSAIKAEINTSGAENAAIDNAAAT